MAKNAPAPTQSSSGGAVLLAVVIIGVLVAIGFAYNNQDDDQQPGNHGGLHTIILQTVYGEIQVEGTDDEGRPLRYLTPHRERALIHQYWINNVGPTQLEAADNMSDEPGFFEVEFIVGVGDTILYEVTQHDDGWVMCSAKQDGITMALSIIQEAGVCRVEHIVMGTVWP